MTASGDYALPLHRLRGLPAGRGINHFGSTRVGGPGSGDSGYLPGLAPPRLTSPSTRLQAYSLWEILTFMLNSLLFILIGLQLPTILEGISEDYSPTTLALYAAAACLAVIVARCVWIFPATYLPRRVSRRLRERDPSPPWQNVAVIAYAGMRGAVSLAAALALPVEFPGRDLVLFLTFCVIFVTLVG